MVDCRTFCKNNRIASSKYCDIQCYKELACTGPGELACLLPVIVGKLACLLSWHSDRLR